jgi:divalent metal cation (Fe/Co/Zn/Cd) transporter
MFTPAFWIIFALGILMSLGFSIFYGRRAIHPRLRPHFGLVVVVFLVLVLASFLVAAFLGKLVGGGMEEFDPEKIRQRTEQAAEADGIMDPAEPKEPEPDDPAQP